MNVNNKPYQTIWLHPDDSTIVQTIDQRMLPFEFRIVDLTCFEDARSAIADMVVRGAPLIGVTAAYGMYLAMLDYPSKEDLTGYLNDCAARLMSTRPTAINLPHAVERSLHAISGKRSIHDQVDEALKTAQDMAKEEVEASRKIGEFGLKVIRDLAKKKRGSVVNILTHCNAGWLACIDYGTATAPVYMAHDLGIKVHVWVDETRPRNQGARLTAWELAQHGVPHTVITDNAGGLLMQQGKVDMVIVGSDRTTLSGHVVNKIGTYLKALAARDNHIPFYVALPSSSIDSYQKGGLEGIQIEERSREEVEFIEGLTGTGLEKVRICSEATPVVNPGFDTTPPHLITGLITERGICEANEKEILRLFPEFGKST